MKEGFAFMRGGFTFVEVLLALTLSFLLAAGSWSLVLVHSRGSVEAAATADRLDAARIVRGVVASELHSGLEGRDWSVFGPDSVVMRAFRGVAVPCGTPSAGVATVLVRSERRAEPAKDSVLVLRPDGRWLALDLEDAGPASITGGGGEAVGTSVDACALPDPRGIVEEWTVPGLDGEFLVARIFERGSYHLVDEAFRYRSGAGGRQPLTQGMFDPRESFIEADASSPTALRLRLGFQDSGGRMLPPPWETTLWLDRP
ncbi:MAG: hypothetical protein ACOC5J_00035 [Gemmatimonadota bacterium]